MAKLLHMKTRVVDVEHLHFYGCSYPAGHELTDPKKKNKVYEGKELARAQVKNKTLSFPRSIAEHFDITETNNAIYGASNEHSLYLLMRDILKGKIKRNHAIFFCITKFTRIMEFDPVDGMPLSHVLGETGHSGDTHGLESKLGLLEHYNDYKCLFNYFQCLYTVIQMAKSVGAPLYFLTMFDSITWNNLRDYVYPYDPIISEIPEKIQEWTFARQITEMSREIECYAPKLKYDEREIRSFEFMCDTYAKLKKVSRSSIRSPGMHPNQEMHNIYAGVVATALTPKIDK
jgi:hypothetical protein